MQGVPLDEVVVSAEGEMNARGFFGISEDVKKGYERVRVNMQVKSDADVDTLTAMAMHSPIFEIVSRSVPADFNMTKI